MAITLTNTDKGIIAALQKDGKTTNNRIAKEIGVSEETIRRRVHRLIGDGVISIKAIPNAAKLGLKCEVLIGIQTEPSMINDVATALGEIDEVFLVTITTGSYSIFAQVKLASQSDLLKFMTDKMNRIPGIVSTETFINLLTLKQDYSLPV